MTAFSPRVDSVWGCKLLLVSGKSQQLSRFPPRHVLFVLVSTWAWLTSQRARGLRWKRRIPERSIIKHLEEPWCPGGASARCSSASPCWPVSTPPASGSSMWFSHLTPDPSRLPATAPHQWRSVCPRSNFYLKVQKIGKSVCCTFHSRIKPWKTLPGVHAAKDLGVEFITSVVGGKCNITVRENMLLIELRGFYCVQLIYKEVFGHGVTWLN